MKLNPIITRVLLLCLLSMGCHAEQAWWKSFGEVELGDFAGGYHPNSEKQASKELVEFLKQTEFKEWETHEDALVRISYPKHPLLKLEIHGGNDGVSVEGGVCTTVDNSYQKAYVLKAGEFTYGVFLVNAAEWLDDGICLCGPMVHHVYQTKDGCLTRYSLLPGGAVKKAQKLGGKLRLMAFEWTHLACPHQVYEQLVDRMTLKSKHPKSDQELRQEVINCYGLDGMAGFLWPGATLAEAEELFHGKPRREDGKLTWTGLVGDYPCKVVAHFDNDIFVKLDRPVRRTGEPAVKGTLSWISDRMEDGDPKVVDLTESRDGKQDQKHEFTTEEKEEMVQALIAVAPTRPDHWWESLDLMQQMIREWKIPASRFTDLILKHGDGNPDELAILMDARHERLTEWVEQHLAREINGEKPRVRNQMFEMGSDASGRAQAYLEYFIRESPPRVKPAVEALWAAEKRRFVMAVVNVLPGLDAGLADEYAKKALAKAIEKSDPEVLEELMEVLPHLKLSNPEGMLKEIDRFEYPDREGVYLPENYWKNKKDALRKALGR